MAVANHTDMCGSKFVAFGTTVKDSHWISPSWKKEGTIIIIMIIINNNYVIIYISINNYINN